MQSFTLLLSLLVVAACSKRDDTPSPAAEGDAVSPPVTRIETVEDEYHGRSVADPYRWLEDWGSDEVRAWSIKGGTEAVDAAETVHSDMKKGFIRAEVLAYDDLMEAGSYAAARKKGTVRLEGKTYEVKDGDIISIRFNV